MNHPRLWAEMVGNQWAMRSQTLETMHSILKRENADIKALAREQGQALENTRRAEVRGSTAIIPVTGPLFRRANLFTEISGATSYDIVSRDLHAALDNSDVDSIVLEIDSPGGMANGVGELSQMIRAASEVKPVVAYVGANAASAGYYLAAAAGKIVVNKSAMLGSIGTVVGIPPKSEEDEGFDIVSTQSPYKRVDVYSDDGRAQYQKMVDELAQIFIDDVAQYRGVTSEKVIADFGQGGELIGQAAVDAGMADELGTFEGVLAQLSGAAGQERPFNGDSQTLMGGSQMPDKNAPANDKPEINVAYLRENHSDVVSQIEASATEGMVKAGEQPNADAIKAEAAKGENERIMGILGAESAAERPKLAMTLAGQPGMTVEQATAIMESAGVEKPKNGGNDFDAAMSEHAPNPDIDAEKETTGKQTYAEESTALGKQFGIE